MRTKTPVTIGPAGPKPSENFQGANLVDECKEMGPTMADLVGVEMRTKAARINLPNERIRSTKAEESRGSSWRKRR